ncbi:MAG: hypothetical protein HBSAPP04_05720 [Ignavibacteriaceae bacterium]|nr:MAG: hypothetical protein HBSAPP04_05720 [Ignavibacteriaceae bacterium]
MRSFISTDIKTAGIMLSVLFILSFPLNSQKMKITIDYPEWNSQSNLIGSSILFTEKKSSVIQPANMEYHENKIFVKEAINNNFVENINRELSGIYELALADHNGWGWGCIKELHTNSCVNAGPFLSLWTNSLVRTPAGTFSEIRNLNFNTVTSEKLKLDQVVSPNQYDKIMTQIRKKIRNDKKLIRSFGEGMFYDGKKLNEQWYNFDSWLETARITPETEFSFTKDSLYIFIFAENTLFWYSRHLIIAIPFSELKSYAAEGSPIEYFNNLQSAWGKIKSSFGPLWFDATKSALEEHVQKESSIFYTVAQLPDYARSEIESYFPGKDFSAVKIYKSVPLNSLKTKIGVINTITDLLGGVKPAAQTFGNNIYFEDFEPGRLEDRWTLLHELVHVIQYSKLGYNGFRDAYVKAVAGGMSYYQIPLEIEAYNFTGH